MKINDDKLYRNAGVTMKADKTNDILEYTFNQLDKVVEEKQAEQTGPDEDGSGEDRNAGTAGWDRSGEWEGTDLMMDDEHL